MTTTTDKPILFVLEIELEDLGRLDFSDLESLIEQARGFAAIKQAKLLNVPKEIDLDY